MKSLIKNSSFFLFLFLTVFLKAQKPIAPMQLKASYQKYNNRIELTWHEVVAQQYKIYRREESKKIFELVDSVSQGRYIDKKELKFNVSYIYHVLSVSSKGKFSTPSNEAKGALLVVASDKDTSLTSNLSLKETSLKECIDITLSASKFLSQTFILKFSISSKCEYPKSVILTLYRSDDDQLDENDNFLKKETIELTNTRGTIISKHNGEPTKGFLILKVGTNDSNFIAARKIE